MFRGDVYNTSPWETPRALPQYPTQKKLDRRSRHDFVTAELPRSHNTSNSFRIKRTEHSSERINLSRQRELRSQDASGISGDGYNDSMRRIPRRMGSVLSLNRRRPADANRIAAAGPRGVKNVVENLYMLTNNVPQYAEHHQAPPEPFQDVYNQRGYPYPRQKNGRYDKITDRKPSRSPQPHPLESPNRYRDYQPRRAQQSPRPLPQQSPRYRPDQSPRRYPDHAGYSNQGSRGRHREQGYGSRSPTPTRGSVLRSRRSKDGASLRGSRQDGYRPVGHGRENSRRYPQNQMRRLQQKYTENIYELNNQNKYPVRQKQIRHNRDKYEADIPYRDGRNYDRDKSRNSRDRRHDQRRYPYRDEGPQRFDPRYDDGYEEQEEFYRDSRYEDVYHQRSKASSRRQDKINSNNSGKNYPYGYPDQIPSTTVGAKTLPQISRYDSISDASIPIQSVRSQKELNKNTYYQHLPQKKSLKLDRPKQKYNGKKDKNRPPQWKSPYDQSDIEDRWKKNNIQLQHREKDQYQGKGKQKNQRIIEDRNQTANLPSGSMFLPVESKQVQKKQWAEDLTQKVIVHLQNLNLIADYTKQFKQMYDNLQPWQVLIFLSYKKFYIERIKVTSTLKAIPSKDMSEYVSSSLQQADKQTNPFILPYSKITDQEVIKFRETKECFALLIELESENARIRDALRGLYNRYIEKSGDHVNMLDCDNFSEQIFKFMRQELEGIAENLDEPELATPTRVRMGKIIKVALLIAFLNGKHVKNFSQILLHEDMIKVGKRQTLREDNISKLFLEEFKRVIV